MRLSTHYIAISFALLVGIVSSCKQKEEDHLPRNVMAKVLLDINLAESYSAISYDSLHRIGRRNPDSLALYYKSVFSHYHITSQQFDASMAWYKAHPEELDTIINDDLPILAAWQSGQKK